jgi:hypothetical protein
MPLLALAGNHTINKKVLLFLCYNPIPKVKVKNPT